MNIEQLRQIKTFHSLVRFLRDELDWPIDSDDVEDITFEYDPAELGFDASEANLIKEIKQLRPLDSKQPWGIFWVDFVKKKLPVVVLRRVLGHLVVKKRASASRSSQPAWHMNDLLFLSAYGEDHDRAITLAHFWQNPENPTDLPVLKVLGWDGGDTVLHLADAYRTLSDHLRWPDDPSDLETWRSRWTSAFPLRHREVIETTQQLVSELARLATDIRKRTSTLLARESKTGPLRRLYSSFQATLIHDLAEEDFADVIAQTVTYGLLAAKFSHKAGISVSTLVDMVPRTNPFLRELLGTFLSLAGRKGAFDFDELGFHEVVDLLNHANTDAVKADFGNRTRNEDPVIHFYEHFLTAYDKKMKIKRGIFYTPQPVVSYIVRSVHELLQTEFGIEDGLASTITWGEMQKRIPVLKIPDGVSPDEFFVNILDPATGTATFLVEIIEVIFNHLINKWDKDGLAAMPAIPNRQSSIENQQFKDYWNAYVPHALLPRLYGYELMMAPYTIAHMKFGLKLSEINARLGQPDYEMEFGGRAHIYLTNSLEPPSDLGQQDLIGIFPALAHEAQAVNDVKRKKRFTVVVGNPPYSVYSSNDIPFIRNLMGDYKQVAGVPLDEVRIAPLMDDYCKFIRFSDYLICGSSCGIIGMITNHSFLTGPVFRGMRHSLKSRYSGAIMDLHGNYFRGDPARGDTNVFEIKPGVCISVLYQPVMSSPPSLVYAESRGSYEEKLRALASNDEIPAVKVTPEPPLFAWISEASGSEEYTSYTSVTEMFSVGTLGMMTGKDHFMIAWSKEEMTDRIKDLADQRLSDQVIRQKYDLEDSRDWVLRNARAAGFDPKRVMPVNYRPFDIRWTYYHKDCHASPQRRVNDPMLIRGNLALCVPRQLASLPFEHCFVTNHVTEMSLISNKTKEANRVFPLFLGHSDGSLLDSESQSNLSPRFVNCLETLSDSSNYQHAVAPEGIFHYSYAVFHSPGYRSRYAKFLKVDFPRLPLPGSLDLFHSLTRLGSELVALHLMESPKLDNHITTFIVDQHLEVEKVSYSHETVWIDKAKTTGFRGVPEEVWNFHIGGYQVCEKWLKNRKGRRLSEEDITHYQKIVVALSETIRLMAEIDKVIDTHGGWPGAFHGKGKA